ncbi:hypothetical protein SBOR_0736 [Sclerotinia borealis F-4128]|uniref:Cutinase n=1 Tax=Sclerotinia borealis (strain F-4128) TaxID=1432307 RepID=W9CS11_SCLBF|nr:hypothetical protein SBOR_0736 [Sclerotinia borealis F-4128]
MKITLPLLLSLSTLVLAHPLAETDSETTTKIETPASVPEINTEHLANTADFFSSDAAAAAVITTENGLSTDACKPVIMIFARGTNEDGNVGTIAGPPLFTDLRAALTTAKISVQGVAYSANVFGYLAGGDTEGSKTLASLTNQASTKCPSAKLVLGGYSQGAQLVHNAAKTLSAAVSAKIAAVIVFGDPDNGQAVGSVPSSKVLSICHAQDIICTKRGGFTTREFWVFSFSIPALLGGAAWRGEKKLLTAVLIDLTYGIDAATASAFIVKAVGSV